MSKRARHQARFKAVQAIYQWDFGDHSGTEICEQFSLNEGLADADEAFFNVLVRGVIKQCDELDSVLADYVDRSVEALDPVERSVLRLAVFELKNNMETPYKVVINEAVELTKTFGAEGGHKYINGVLDRCAKPLRPLEIA